jgi:hypothetical protein
MEMYLYMLLKTIVQFYAFKFMSLGTMHQETSLMMT